MPFIIMFKICFYIISTATSARLHLFLYKRSFQTIQKHHTLNRLILNVRNIVIPKIKMCKDTISGSNRIFICLTNMKYMI